MNLPESNIRCASISTDGEPSSRIGYWCAWCEEVHEVDLGHELRRVGGRPLDFVDHRACCCSRRSPMAGRKVVLEIDRIVRSVDLIDPPGPYLAGSDDRPESRVHLASLLGNGRLALALLRLLFGDAASIASTGFEAEIAGGRVQVFGGGASWFVNSAEGPTVASGNGLGALMARLFGVPIGVAAVRVLEDALGIDLPAAYRLGIADLVDRAECGAPMPVIAEEVVVSLGRRREFDLGEILEEVAVAPMTSEGGA